MAEYGRLTRSSEGKEGRVIVMTVDEWIARFAPDLHLRRQAHRIQARMPGWNLGLADSYAIRDRLNATR